LTRNQLNPHTTNAEGESKRLFQITVEESFRDIEDFKEVEMLKRYTDFCLNRISENFKKYV